MEQLKAKSRNKKDGSLAKVRNAGGIPAVVYGHKIPNVNLTLENSTFAKLHKTAGETTVVDLHVEGEKAPRKVLIHDVSRDPVRNFITHVDLYQINADEKIKTHVPLVFVGESAAVKSDGGVLVKNIYKVEVEALFQDFPHEITIDISKLATFNDTITIADMPVSDKVKVHADPKEIIAKVMPPRTESEMEALKEEVVMKVDDVKTEGEEKKKEKEAAKAAEEKTEK